MDVVSEGETPDRMLRGYIKYPTPFIKMFAFLFLQEEPDCSEPLNQLSDISEEISFRYAAWGFVSFSMGLAASFSVIDESGR